jgi:hypothetical protein
MAQPPDTPERWRSVARDCRIQAEAMHDDAARRGMRSVAESYERLTADAERWLAHPLRRSLGAIRLSGD